MRELFHALFAQGIVQCVILGALLPFLCVWGCCVCVVSLVGSTNEGGEAYGGAVDIRVTISRGIAMASGGFVTFALSVLSSAMAVYVGQLEGSHQFLQVR